MIEGGIGLDAPLQHAVDQAVVEVETGLVDGAGALGDEARPGEGEAIGVKARVADQIEILGPEFVVIAGVEAGIAIVDIAGGGGERIPDRTAPTVALPALDLVGGRGRAKGEVGTEIPPIERKHGHSSAALGKADT